MSSFLFESNSFTTRTTYFSIPSTLKHYIVKYTISFSKRQQRYRNCMYSANNFVLILFGKGDIHHLENILAGNTFSGNYQNGVITGNGPQHMLGGFIVNIPSNGTGITGFCFHYSELSREFHTQYSTMCNQRVTGTHIG